MKALVTAVLAMCGTCCLAIGTVARAQSGYTCNYDCYQACGSYACYYGDYYCSDSGGRRLYQKCDTKKLGGCSPGNEPNCPITEYVCSNTLYPSTDPVCGVTCCALKKTVTMCVCIVKVGG